MKSMTTSRRSFLGASIGGTAGLAIGGALPGSWMQSLAASELKEDRILIVIQLSGGNDGLNTVVPYRHDDYRKARPKLGIPTADVLKIDDDFGFHPTMGGIHKLLEDGRFSIVQGVGYASPNRSHFESMDIWHTCHRKEERTGEGWLGRWIVSTQDKSDSDARGLHLGAEQQPIALAGRGIQVPSVATIDQFRLNVDGGELLGNRSMAEEDSEKAKMESKAGLAPDSDPLLGFLEASTQAALEASARLEKAMKTADDGGDFPQTQLGEKLRVISRLILAGISTKVYYVTLDGFDTHSQQPLAHAGLLRQWSDALSSFVKRMEQAGQSERVLVMTFSEFGRRVAENASEGTDHGAAAPLYFSGPKLDQPFVGALPSLTDLEDGDLKFHTDFRQVYATVIENWLGGSSESILGGKYEKLSLFKT